MKPLNMAEEEGSIGIQTTRFSSGGFDKSLSKPNQIWFDESSQRNIFSLERGKQHFKNYVQSEIKSLWFILPVVGIIYNLKSILDVVLRQNFSDIEVTLPVHIVSLLLQFLANIFLCTRTSIISVSVSFLVCPVLIITVDILWDVYGRSVDECVFHWVLLMSYITIPILSSRCFPSIALSVLLFINYIITQRTSTEAIQENGYTTKQVSMDIRFFLSALIHGYACYFSLENEYLMVYLEKTRVSKYEKITSEESKVKNRLMTAVLPVFIADEISREFDVDSKSSFRKLYITKYDNVTILFADIVGFTAISSFYSATRLVNMLNEIFETLDRTAEKYHQLRLKILGDCYYCICGVPEPRPDHAELSVCMGFGIIDAIRIISTKVNMRVGIHTGSVLSGVLGNRQWQFDIFGKNAKIANLMESSSMPGKVHITHVTKALLKEKYIITASEAGNNEELLRQSHIQTFFIAPFNNQEYSCSSFEDVVDHNMIENKENISNIETLHENTDRKFEKEYSTLTLHFKEKELENNFQSRHLFLSLQPYSYVLVFMIGFTNDCTSNLLCWKCVCLMFISSVILLFNIITLSQEMDGFMEKSLAVYIFDNILICVSSFVLLVFLLTTDPWIVLSVQPANQTSSGDGTTVVSDDRSMLSTSYSLSGDVLPQFLLLVTGLNETLSLRHSLKIGLLSSITVIFLVIIGYLHPGVNFNLMLEDMKTPVITVLSIVLIVIFMDRQVERAKRKIYVQRINIASKYSRLEKLRRKNKKLLYSLILPDIGRNFLLMKRNGNSLHSKAYDNVGVMFASCPHFDEFYTENSTYEDGLGCLRFLNEIISDYDELFQEDQFADLCKIKTIGATYMVASGLRKQNDSLPSEENDRCKRWEHLRTLLNFALKMSEVLDEISNHSFTSFKLRIGINHGPVIAGVVGTQKPHYDIFGNTVNVASRMESTGVRGEIQVLKNTAHILQQFGYNFTLRGSVNVKGKGNLLTYFLSRPNKTST